MIWRNIAEEKTLRWCLKWDVLGRTQTSGGCIQQSNWMRLLSLILNYLQKNHFWYFQVIVAKSHEAKLVILNLPGPPKVVGKDKDCSCKYSLSQAFTYCYFLIVSDLILSLPRHGVSGGADRRTWASTHGSRGWQRSYYHLLLGRAQFIIIKHFYDFWKT